ncbi:hypothetical protein [Saccharothrix xinjiangensis]|uniref:Uncharacterized protein n=1 Tax=Saccharothrix xinjiangensis TaxID=204798 RepID=A0ABV9Y5P2_9PSEU
MSRESESERTQRTVAELLAQYGGGAGGEVAPRRRRRRAEDASDTAPQAIIERVNSDSGRLLPVRDEPPAQPPQTPPPPPRDVEAERTAYQPPVQPPPAAPPVAGAPPRGEPPSRAAPPATRSPVAPELGGRRRAPDVDPAEETRVVPPIVDDFGAEPVRSGAPAPPVPPAPSAPDLSRLNPQVGAEATRLTPPVGPDATRLTPPVGAEATRLTPPVVPEAARTSLVRPVSPPVPPPVREPVTEVLPRVPDELRPNVPLESLPTESVLIVPPAPPRLPEPLPDQSAEDWFGDDGPEGGPGVANRLERGDRGARPEPESTQFHPYVDLDEEDEDDDYAPPSRGRRFDDDEPAGLSDVDEVDDEPGGDRSAGKEWLVMLGQLAVGVVGGAALWLGFNFLWRTLAPAALVVALVVTVGLVMLVRKIRRADDLQTTVLAVLVGLIVTVSPAAMLLVKS